MPAITLLGVSKRVAEFKRRVFGVRSEVLAVLHPNSGTSSSTWCPEPVVLEGWPVLV